MTVGAGAWSWNEVGADGAAGEPSAPEASRGLLQKGAPEASVPGACHPRPRAALATRPRERRAIPRRVRAHPLPCPEFMAARYKVAVASPLVPLLYLWRPVRGVWALVTGR